MNIMEGGKGGFISDEQQLHRSNCASKALQFKLKNDPEFKKEHHRRISNGLKGKYCHFHYNKYYAFKGKKHSEESKKLISKNKKNTGIGINNSQYGTCWIYNLESKVNKKIKLNELNEYLELGWFKGTKTEFYKKKIN